jgi:HD-GYP domain-containing protein (c-di-GMP phosphodiesterase class II)
MGEGDPHLDRRSIHAVLIKRLALVTLLIAVALGCAVYAIDRQHLRQTIIERGMQGAAQFMGDAGSLLAGPGPVDREGVQRELEAVAGRRQPGPEGRMVAVTVYAAAGAVAARLAARDSPLHAAAVAYLAALPPPPGEPPEPEARWIQVAQTEHILVRLPLRASDGRVVGQAVGLFAVSPGHRAQLTQRIRRTVATAVAIVLITTALLYPVILRLTRQLATLSIHLLDANLETLRVLGSAIAKRDADTDVHNYRVTIYAVRLAEALGLDGETIQGLIKGAFVHDVGKIGIPDRILLKPGRLTEEEFAEMKTHVNHGLDIVQRSPWLQDAAAVVGNHHEKVDGSGYRGGLKAGEIPLTARIFAIADVFDAITSRRPYHEPLGFDEAMALLERGRGTHFEGGLLDAFAGIARPLFDEFADRDDETPRREVARLVQRYFTHDLGALLA